MIDMPTQDTQQELVSLSSTHELDQYFLAKMVLEGVVVAVLNKFLGPYVKNLDSSQLKVAIWSGKVQLEGLQLKESALSQFGMPFRILQGQLGSLHMTIPWSNLYSDPVIIEVDGFYAVIQPESAVKYDPGKELKEQLEKKQRKLKEIEETKEKAGKTEEASNPGFVEKLITQIIRNVQLTVRNIHISYEDKVSSGSIPFTCGITLDSLLMKSTNGKWEILDTPPNTEGSDNPIIYKMIRLNCFSLYCNSGVTITDKLGPKWKERLIGQISRFNSPPVKDFTYIISPLSATTKLQLTTRPKGDNTPMIVADLNVDSIALSLSKQQYRHVLSLTDSVDRMIVGRMYRKYRPSTTISANRRIWWKFAYSCILEDVKRRLYMWSWKRMKKHRMLCREYVKYYTEKLVNTNVPAYVSAKLEDIEDDLDILNITICRQLAENEAQKQLAKIKKSQEESGWFGGWFGGGSSSDKSTSEDLPTEKQIILEKEKLYSAIGYSEKGKMAKYPPDYIAHKFKFKLKEVTVKLLNGDQIISNIVTTSVTVSGANRPSSKNITIKAGIQSFEITGVVDGKLPPPQLISSIVDTDSDESLLSVEFELNPLNSKTNQIIRLSVLPVNVVYDAPTINALLDTFIPPSPIKLQTMSSGISATLASLRTQTRAGLEHVVDKRKIMDIDITLCSPIIHIPQNGVMTSNANTIVINLGSLNIRSDMKHNVPNVREATYEELMEAFYDHLNLTVNSVQLSLIRGGGYHVSLIDPIRFTVGIHKSLLPNDTKLPGIKIDGDIPLVSVTVSDRVIKEVAVLFKSLPLPPPALSNRKKQTTNYSDISIAKELSSINNLLTVSEVIKDVQQQQQQQAEQSDDDFITASEGEDEKPTSLPPQTVKIIGESHDQSDSDIRSTTKVAMKFNLSQVKVKLKTTHGELFDIQLSSLQTSVDVRSWDNTITASLQSITVYDRYLLNNDDSVLLLSTSDDSSFISAKIVMANRDSPYYKSHYNKTEKYLSLKMAKINTIVRQETVCYILEVADDLKTALISKSPSPQPVATPDDGDKAVVTPTNVAKPATPTRSPIDGEVLMNINVSIEGTELIVRNNDLGDMATSSVSGIKLMLTKQLESTMIQTSIEEFSLLDPRNSEPVKVVYCPVTSDPVIDSRLTLYDHPEDGFDMKVILSMKQVQALCRIQLFANLLVFVRALKISQKSIEQAKDTAKNTATAALDKVKERDKSNKRIKLDISIDSPSVVIPSAGDAVLIAHLGSLKIVNNLNTIHDLPYEIFNIQMSSIRVYSNINKIEDNLLKPFELTLLLKRNLSGDYSLQPMLNVDLKFSSFELLVSKKDTIVAAEIISYNTNLLPLLKSADDSNNKKVEERPSTSSTIQDTEVKTEQPKETVDTVVNEDYQLLQFGISMSLVGVTIFKSETGHEAENQVTVINVDTITSSGSVSSGGAITCDLAVNIANITDSRPNTGLEQFQSVLSKHSGGSDPLLTVSTSIDRSDMIVKLSLLRPQLAFNIPFVLYLLLTLQEMLSPLKAMNAKQKKIEEKKQQQLEEQEEQDIMEEESTNDGQIQENESVKDEKEQPKQQRNIRFIAKIIEPQLVLLTIHDVNKTADSLVVECSLDLSIAMNPSQTNVFAGVNQVKINCNLKNDAYKQPILLPCDISSSLSMLGPTQKNLSFNVGEMQLCVTPSIVRVILKVLSELKPKQMKEDTSVTAPDGLWLTQPINYDKWYLRPLVLKPSVLKQLLSANNWTKKDEEEEEIVTKHENFVITMQQVSVVVYLEDPRSGVLSTAFSVLVGCYGSHGIKATVQEWTGKLYVDADICVCMSAYNTVSDNWEPVLEPMLDEKGQYTPWTLKLTASKGNTATHSLSPSYLAEISSDNALQLTVTKSSVTMILSLMKSFQLVDTSFVPQSITDVRFRNSKMIFHNKLGPSYGIKLTPKQHIEGTDSVIDLFPGTTIELRKEDNIGNFIPGEIIPKSQQQKHVVNVNVLGFRSFDILTKSSGSKYFPLIPNKGDAVFGMVVDIDRATASDPTVITFRSPLQIKNHLDVPFKVYWTPPKSKDLILQNSIEPNQKSYLPINVAHSGNIFFQPVINNVTSKPSSQPVSWRIGRKGTNIECHPVFLHVNAEVESYLDRLPFSLSNRPHHILHVHFTVVVHNRLLHHYIQLLNDTIPPGGMVELHKCDPDKKYETPITVKGPNDEYKGVLRIGHEHEEQAMALTSSTGTSPGLELSVYREMKGTMNISLYSKCIIANKTGLDLEYSTKDFWGKRKSVQHLKEREYLLFSGSEIFVKTLGDRESEWSNKFSLDALGNEGYFTCKVKDTDIDLQMGCKVQSSNFSLSKIVSITPFYMLVNNTKDTVSVLEYGQHISKTIIVKPKEVIPFWPVQAKKLIIIDINNHEDNMATFSRPFNYSANGAFFLKLSSTVTGVSVNVHITPSASLISFDPYFDGAVPFKIINATEFPIIYGQSKKVDEGQVDDMESVHTLLPDRTQFYTWDNPNGMAQLKWGISQNEEQLAYHTLKMKDGHGYVPLLKKAKKKSSFRGVVKGVVGSLRHSHADEDDGDKCYYVSLSDSFQRVILFTTHKIAADRASGSQMVKMMAKITLSLKAVGLSLVNDLKRTEVSYIGLTQSNAIWKKMKNEIFVPVEFGLGAFLEEQYKDDVKKVVPIPDSGMKVDFRNKNKVLLIINDEKVELERSCINGFTAVIGYSSNAKSLSLQINKIQIDNNLPFALNPTIFYCYPPPPSIAAVVVPKPFIEASLIMKTNDGAANNEIQFCQVLIQEMGFILDIEFLLEILSLIDLKKEAISNNDLLKRDIELIRSKLEKDDIDQITSSSSRLNFKFIHLSPIDVHVSFSLDLSEDKKDEMMFYAESNVLLKMFLDFFHTVFGIIGQAKDAEIKLGYFELQERVLSRQALVKRIIKHYQHQFVYQMYSVVLGLEVLGNPVGFLRGFTEGTIGLFYQPIQGAVLGPEEFFQGLALGTHQFIGGTFGGIAGVGARFTGVVGDVVAKLTFDDEFMEQRKRQQSSLGQGLDSLTKGVFHGLTGIVTQPISGAQKEGFIGFLKGTSRGVLGLVLRPAGGLIDFTSATLTVVQKKTQVGDFQLVQMRAPRYIAPDKIVYPYSPNLAEGYAVFLLYDDGKLYNEETYIGYQELTANPLKVLLVTNNRFMVLKQGGTFVTKWEEEFQVKYKIMLEQARIDGTSKTVMVTVSEDESWLGGLVLGGGHGKKKVNVKKKVPAIPREKAEQSVALINSGFESNVKDRLLMF